jgi:hypothetical protein
MNGFTFDMSGVDRGSLLASAAATFDGLAASLGGAADSAETEAGTIARALAGDQASFSKFPDVYQITDRTFLARDLQVPARFKELSRDFRFYWLYVPIGLIPQYNWGFNRLEVAIEFNPDETRAERRPRAYQILPAKQFQDLITATAKLEVRIDENFEFAARAPAVSLPANLGSVGASVEASAAGAAGLTVGPFEYHIKRSKIDHTPVGMEHVWWRIDGAEFFQEDSPEMIVLVQVPSATKRVAVAAALQAYRYFNFATAGLRESVKHLPDAVRTFFQAGAPLRADERWDLTPRLRNAK